MKKRNLATDPHSSRWFAENMALMIVGKDFGYKSDLVKSLEAAFRIKQLPKMHRDTYEIVARKVGTVPYPANHWTSGTENKARRIK